MLHEIELFFLGTAAGMCLSLCFDLFRAFRKVKAHREWAVALEDLIFWILVSGTVFLMIQTFNKGVLRFYIFLGCGLGALFYFLTITRLVFPVFYTVFKVMKGILSKCCMIFEIIKKIFKNFVILPLKKIWEGIKMVCNNI